MQDDPQNSDELTDNTDNSGSENTPQTSVTQVMDSIADSGYGQFANIGADGNPVKKSDGPTSNTPAKEEPVSQEILPATEQRPKIQRDFTGIPEEMHGLFRKMGNEAFSAIKPQIIEAIKLKEEHEALKKQLESVTGQHLYEQEDAYTITPEYKQVYGDLNHMGQEEAHWRQQLENIEGGNKVSLLLRDPRSGQIYRSEEMDPTPQHKVQIQQKLFEATSLRSQLETQLNGLQGQFKSKHNDYITGIKALEEQIYKQVPREKVQPHADKVLQMFPPHMRNRADVKAFAAVGGINALLMAEMAKLKSTQSGKTIQKRIATSGVPTSESTSQNANGGRKIVKDTIEEMERFKQNGYV